MPKRDKKVQDFKRRKRKLGKKLAAASETRTDFKVKAILLPSQSGLADRSGDVTTSRRQTATDLLPHLEHHNRGARVTAIQGFGELLVRAPKQVEAVRPELFQKLSLMVRDRESSVRAALLVLYGQLFDRAPEGALTPFVPMLLAQIAAAMTHRSEMLRESSLSFLDFFLRRAPEAVARTFPVVSQLISMLSTRTTKLGASGAKNSNGHMHMLEIDPTGCMAKPATRAAVLRCLTRFLSTAFPPASPLAAKEENAVSDRLQAVVLQGKSAVERRNATRKAAKAEAPSSFEKLFGDSNCKSLASLNPTTGAYRPTGMVIAPEILAAEGSFKGNSISGLLSGTGDASAMRLESAVSGLAAQGPYGQLSSPAQLRILSEQVSPVLQDLWMESVPNEDNLGANGNVTSTAAAMDIENLIRPGRAKRFAKETGKGSKVTESAAQVAVCAGVLRSTHWIYKRWALLVDAEPEQEQELQVIERLRALREEEMGITSTAPGAPPASKKTPATQEPASERDMLAAAAQRSHKFMSRYFPIQVPAGKSNEETESLAFSLNMEMARLLTLLGVIRRGCVAEVEEEEEEDMDSEDDEESRIEAAATAAHLREYCIHLRSQQQVVLQFLVGVAQEWAEQAVEEEGTVRSAGTVPEITAEHIRALLYSLLHLLPHGSEEITTDLMAALKVISGEYGAGSRITGVVLEFVRKIASALVPHSPAAPASPISRSSEVAAAVATSLAAFWIPNAPRTAWESTQRGLTPHGVKTVECCLSLVECVRHCSSSRFPELLAGFAKSHPRWAPFFMLLRKGRTIPGPFLSLDTTIQQRAISAILPHVEVMTPAGVRVGQPSVVIDAIGAALWSCDASMAAFALGVARDSATSAYEALRCAALQDCGEFPEGDEEGICLPVVETAPPALPELCGAPLSLASLVVRGINPTAPEDENENEESTKATKARSEALETPIRLSAGYRAVVASAAEAVCSTCMSLPGVQDHEGASKLTSWTNSCAVLRVESAAVEAMGTPGAVSMAHDLLGEHPAAPGPGSVGSAKEVSPTSFVGRILAAAELSASIPTPAEGQVRGEVAGILAAVVVLQETGALRKAGGVLTHGLSVQATSTSDSGGQGLANGGAWAYEALQAVVVGRDGVGQLFEELCGLVTKVCPCGDGSGGALNALTEAIGWLIMSVRKGVPQHLLRGATPDSKIALIRAAAALSGVKKFDESLEAEKSFEAAVAALEASKPEEIQSLVEAKDLASKALEVAKMEAANQLCKSLVEAGSDVAKEISLLIPATFMA